MDSTVALRARTAPRVGFGIAMAVLLSVLPAIHLGAARALAYDGFGASTPGGDGGALVRVTNLNDAGPGSLRDAVSQGSRTVVFDVGGTIELSTAIRVTGAFITIDGLAAPSPGITLHGAGLVVRGSEGAHDVIIRGIRVRDASEDGVQIASGAYNVVVDRVSIQGSADGNLDITEGARDITVSWSILAAPASRNNMLIKYGASRVSLHHTLLMDAVMRNPLVATDDAATPASELTADIRNNVVWHWGPGFGTRVQAARVNAVNNLYSSPGPDDDQRAALRVCTGSCPGDPPIAGPGGRLHASLNFSAERLGFVVNEFGTEEHAFPAPAPVGEDTCLTARRVVAEAGVHPLDTRDEQRVATISLPACPAVLLKGLYYHALRRPASEDEVQAQLQGFGPAPSIAAVWGAVRGVFDSHELRSISVTPGSYVAALYRAALGREPDGDGLAFYTGQVLARYNALLPFFVGSPELAAARAQLTPEALVTRIFRQALDRVPSDAELQVGIDHVLTAQDLTPGIQLLLNSDEFTATPRSFVRHVRVLYRALLGREPGEDELASWVDYLVTQLAALGARPAEIAEFEARVAATFRP